MAKPILTQEIVRSLLDYDPETGIFTWRHRDRKYFKTDRARKIWNAKFPGKKAGTMHDGYYRIGIFDRVFFAHRLAILYVTGSFPDIEIDHIDRNKLNNAFKNLRMVNRTVNTQNVFSPTPRNKLQIRGVSQVPSKKFVAQITANGKYYHLGRFDSAEEAGAAYMAAKKVLHPDAIQALDTS